MSFITTVDGVKMYLHQAVEDSAVSAQLDATKEWEGRTTAIIRENLKAGQTFVDCGAHIGYFALLASKIVGPEGKVFAFEPYPPNYQLLLKNLALNEAFNVGASDAILWDEPGVKLALRLNTNNNAGDVVAEPTADGSGIPSETLDELLAGASVDFVKVDCQFADHLVLRGGGAVFTRAERMHLVVESPEGDPNNRGPLLAPECFGFRLVEHTGDYNFYYVKP